jgi:hypothetical protein
MRSRSDRRSFITAAAGVPAVLAMIFAGFSFVGPALSQGVALLKVDVAVVAKGLRASKIVGSGVTNDKKEKIGTLDDVIIGKDRVLFAILQVGGFLGVGGRLVAVPYQNLVISDDGKTIQLPGASKEELQKLTEFKYAT